RAGTVRASPAPAGRSASAATIAHAMRRAAAEDHPAKLRPGPLHRLRTDRLKDPAMRLSHLLGSTLLLSLAGAPLAAPSAVAASPASAPVPTAGLVVPAAKAGRTRPLIAVVADSAGAQTTDFIVPYGVLKDSDVAD